MSRSCFLSEKQESIIFDRGNGVQVELVATYFPDYRSNGTLASQFDFYALVREPNKRVRVVTHEILSEESKLLPREEYISRGRVGLMSVVRPHEIFKVSDKLINYLTR